MKIPAVSLRAFDEIAAHKLLVASAEVANSENIKLRAEVERLRAALFKIIEDCHSILQANEIARAALADKGKP